MGTPGPSIGQSVSDSWSERMRMIRLRRKKEAFRFLAELHIIPKWLKILCTVLYVVAVAVCVAVMINYPDARPHDIGDDAALSVLAILGVIMRGSVCFAASSRILGYVHRERDRRGL